MVEKKGEKCLIADLWRTCVSFARCASRLLISSSFSQPGRERLFFGMRFPESSVDQKFILWNSTSIIEEVNRTRDKSEIVARYYFDSKKPDKRNLRGLLGSLVTQLCDNSKRHPKSIPKLYTKCRDGSDQPSEAELTQLLNHFLAELQTQFSIYIVIDGVDNCTETESPESPRKKVLKFLEDLVRSRDHPKLYICITSSLKQGMEKSLKPLAAGASSRQVILHDEEGQKEDVKVYIAAFIWNYMHTWSDRDKDTVIRTLSERAGGM